MEHSAQRRSRPERGNHRLFCLEENPVLPLALYGMHLAEYFIVAKKAGKKVWYDDTRCFINTMLYGFTFWLPMKLEIE